MQHKSNWAVYFATAPVRLFGRSRAFRIALVAVVVLGGAFYGTLWAIDSFLPSQPAPSPTMAKLKPLPDLPPVTRASYVIAPVAVSLSAIRSSLDAAAPRTLVGKNDNPVSSLLSKADIGMTVTRGTLGISGRPGDIAVTAPLNSTMTVTGQIAGLAGNLTGGITGFLNNAIGQQVGGLTTRVLDQRVDVNGKVVVYSRPAITASWRLHPNLHAQLSLGNSAMQLAGIKLNMASEARPVLDQMVNQQVSALEGRLRSDPFIETAARAQWAKMCRAIPLGGGKTGLPKLWLEMRPVRAAAAQPKISAHAVTLTIGVQAETRITPTKITPHCPFPSKLELVPPMDDGRLQVGLPIDVPFTELNKLLEAQLKGHEYPEQKDAAVKVRVQHVQVGASGKRLLISLDVKAREQKSWFGFGASATIDIWGKPVLDAKNQILRLTDVTLAVDSQAAYGLLGAAARAAVPYLQKAVADKAVVDLKPFAADAKKKIATALADFQRNDNGVKVAAEIRDVRLTGIAFDSHTLRVIAEADGRAKVAVSRLPRM
ncbi:MAG: DUF4403 family protein [Pseudolabrys sp.]